MVEFAIFISSVSIAVWVGVPKSLYALRVRVYIFISGDCYMLICWLYG